MIRLIFQTLHCKNGCESEKKFKIFIHVVMIYIQFRPLIAPTKNYQKITTFRASGDLFSQIGFFDVNT